MCLSILSFIFIILLYKNNLSSLETIFNIVIALFILAILGFLPGFFYYKSKPSKSKLINWAIGLKITSIIVIIPLVFLYLMCLITQSTNYCDLFLFPVITLLFEIPFIVLYSLGIFLLIIDYFKNKK